MAHKENRRAFPRVDYSFHLMRHDLNDPGLICRVKKRFKNKEETHPYSKLLSTITINCSLLAMFLTLS